MDKIFSGIASCLVVISFFWQIIQVYRLKSADQIPWVFIVLQFIVNIMYAYYDIVHKAWTLMIANFPLVILLIFLSCQKIYYERRRSEYEFIG